MKIFIENLSTKFPIRVFQYKRYVLLWSMSRDYFKSFLHRKAIAPPLTGIFYKGASSILRHSGASPTVHDCILSNVNRGACPLVCTATRQLSFFEIKSIICWLSEFLSLLSEFLSLLRPHSGLGTFWDNTRLQSGDWWLAIEKWYPSRFSGLSSNEG